MPSFRIAIVIYYIIFSINEVTEILKKEITSVSGFYKDGSYLDC